MRKNGSSLIGAMAALVIVMALMMVWLYWQPDGKKRKPGEKPVSRITETKQAAESVKCKENLNQIRMGIQVERINADEAPPDSLRVLRFPNEMLSCPIVQQPYLYDNRNGSVRCPNPDHANY
ncbi:MAG: hypothetical protein HUU60_01715 [Armatimonadetes bacterium]|nr:hypothetical protein [Armatimonadota bacterium]